MSAFERYVSLWMLIGAFIGVVGPFVLLLWAVCRKVFG